MARKRRPTGDDATNARKRYYRKAERYLRDSEQATGANAKRLMHLAKESLKDAIKTYSGKIKQKFSKPIRELSEKLGIDLDKVSQRLAKQDKTKSEETRMQAISRSAKALQSREIDDVSRREEEARLILNSPIGKRILGGTVDIWRDKATVYDIAKKGATIDKSKILPALYEYFDVGNLADLLERIEDIAGEELYKADDSDEMYESTKISIQKHIATDNSTL